MSLPLSTFSSLPTYPSSTSLCFFFPLVPLPPLSFYCLCWQLPFPLFPRSLTHFRPFPLNLSPHVPALFSSPALHPTFSPSLISFYFSPAASINHLFLAPLSFFFFPLLLAGLFAWVHPCACVSASLSGVLCSFCKTLLSGKAQWVVCVCVGGGQHQSMSQWKCVCERPWLVRLAGAWVALCVYMSVWALSTLMPLWDIYLFLPLWSPEMKFSSTPTAALSLKKKKKLLEWSCFKKKKKKREIQK